MDADNQPRQTRRNIMSKLKMKTLTTTIMSTVLIFSAGALSAAEGDMTRTQSRSQVQDETLETIATQTREEMRTQTRIESAVAVAEQTRTQVREQIRDAVSEEAKDAVRSQTRGGNG